MPEFPTVTHPPASSSTPLTRATILLRAGVLGAFLLAATGSPVMAQANNECANAIVVGIGQNGPFNNFSATPSSPSWPCAGSLPPLDVWFKFTPSQSGLATASLCGASYDTILQVFSGTCGGLVSIACNDDSCGLHSEITWETFCGVDYYLRVGGFQWNRGTFPLNIALVPRTPEIELNYADGAPVLAWNDGGSGASRNGSFWWPNVPAGNSNRVFGGMARGDYQSPHGMIVGRDLSGSAFAPPASYALAWTDAGSGANLDGCFYHPVAPPGYRVLGHAMRACAWGWGPNDIVCARADLCVQGSIGNMIWNDEGSGANSDFSAWDIVAPPGAIDIGGFIGHASHAAPSNSVVWCLRADAVARIPAPSDQLAASLISTHGPVFRMHPAETFLPDDPAVVLNDPNTRLMWETIQNPGSYSSFQETILGQSITSSTLILDTVQTALAHPMAQQADYLYRLDWNYGLRFGNINRARAYVRIQPVDEVFTELQFWMFYPWNGAGKASARCAGLWSETWNPTGTMGEHFSDWENVRVRVTNKSLTSPGSYRLASVVMSRHSADVEVFASDPSLSVVAGHPQIYVGDRSHALYQTTGTQVYRPRASVTNLGLCDLVVDLFDLTAAGGQTFPAYSNYQIVSSAWPGVTTNTPDWFFFGGQWGGFSRNLFSTTVTIFNYTRTETEVENGKPGLLRRNEFNVPHPENANLGSLRSNVGALSPTFHQNTTSYSLAVGTNTTEIRLLPQAMDHNAEVAVRLGGQTYQAPRGVLLGKDILLPIYPGQNVCTIDVRLCSGINRSYTVTVDRPFQTEQHNCGPMSISVTGQAHPGGAVQTTIAGFGAGLPFIGLGFPPGNPWLGCPCTVGHTWDSPTFGTTRTLTIPPNWIYNGIQVAIQGAGFGTTNVTTGTCPGLALTDTIVIGR